MSNKPQEEIQGTVLIVEDQEHFAKICQKRLENKQYRVIIASTLDDAEIKLKKPQPDVVVLDLKFDRGKHRNGLEFIPLIKRESPEAKILVVTALEEFDIGMKAIQRGAYDFLRKDDDIFDVLPFRVDHAFERLQLEREVAQQRQSLLVGGLLYAEGRNIIGKSATMLRIFEQIQRIAPEDSTVLITGESG
ncbi:MAG: response regulator, partial [Nitrospira sp.]|nr:response regulator [Nitrospira sp.]